MNKLPVFATAGESLIFPLSHFFQLARRLSVPVLAILFLQIGVGHFTEIPIDGEVVSTSRVVENVVGIALTLLFLNAYVGTLQVALDLPEATKWFYVDFSEVRVATFYLLYFCGFAALAIILGLLLSGSFPTFDPSGGLQTLELENANSLGPLAIIFFLVLIPVIFWVSIRLVPMPAHIVATKSLKLKMGFVVGRGNSFEVFAAGIVQSVFLFLFIQIPALGLSVLADDADDWRATFLDGLSLGVGVYLLLCYTAFSAIVYRRLTEEPNEASLERNANDEEDHSAA